MDLIQLVYASQPFGFDSPTLAGILSHARRRNAADGVTGALLCRSDVYLQMLEGPEAAVEAAYVRILRDDRHMNAALLLRGRTTQRTFAEWAMLHDPAESVIWSREAIADGLLARLPEQALRDVFARLAAGAADEPAARR